MRLDIINSYIRMMSGCSKEDLLRRLKEDTTLDIHEKNVVYLWYYPLLIGDRELPSKIQAERGYNLTGFDQPEDQELVVLVGAYKSAQYGKFMRHLLHAFTIPEEVHPLSGSYTEECCICGKRIYHHDSWDGKKEHLAYGAVTSSAPLCLNCIIQLQGLNEILEAIEGPDYLNRYKR